MAEPTPADCPYYRGVGTCMENGMNCGFHGEPYCITNEPEGGWDRLDEAKLALADELRQAAKVLRNPYRCGDGAHMEAEADLLEAIADGMDELGAVEGSASKAVHSTTPLGLSAPNRPWTAALAVACAINTKREAADADS